MSRRDKPWRLDEFCPDNCLGMIPSQEGRRICTENRTIGAAVKAGFVHEHPPIREVFLAAGGEPVVAGSMFFTPRWVFSVAASHFTTKELGRGVVGVPGHGPGVLLLRLRFLLLGHLYADMCRDEATVQDVKECLEDTKHRMTRLVLLGHDKNITVRMMALYILTKGYEDPKMPEIPRLRKHWVCLRRANQGAPNGADWLKATRMVKG